VALSLFLFLCRCLFRLLLCRFLRGCALGLRHSRSLGYLPGFRLLPRKLGRAEGLAVEGDLGYPHGCKRLPVPTKFLVLLLALVMEDQNFVVPAFFDHLAADASFRLRLSDLPVAARHGQHVVETYVPVSAVSNLLYPDHIPRRDSILLTTGADHRVHTHSSMKPIPAHTGAPG